MGCWPDPQPGIPALCFHAAASQAVTDGAREHGLEQLATEVLEQPSFL